MTLILFLKEKKNPQECLETLDEEHFEYKPPWMLFAGKPREITLPSSRWGLRTLFCNITWAAILSHVSDLLRILPTASAKIRGSLSTLPFTHSVGSINRMSPWPPFRKTRFFGSGPLSTTWLIFLPLYFHLLTFVASVRSLCFSEQRSKLSRVEVAAIRSVDSWVVCFFVLNHMAPA